MLKFIETVDKTASKDTESTLGPKLLVTVEGNKITPSPSVMDELELTSDYTNEKGSSEIVPGGRTGNAFKVSVVQEDDGTKIPVMHIIENAAAGFKIGKSGSATAPLAVNTLMEVLGLERKDFELEDVIGQETIRSFNVSVDLKNPILLDQAGEEVTDKDEAAIVLYKLTLLGKVGRMYKGKEDSDEATESSETEATETDNSEGQKKRGKKNEAV